MIDQMAGMSFANQLWSTIFANYFGECNSKKDMPAEGTFLAMDYSCLQNAISSGIQLIFMLSFLALLLLTQYRLQRRRPDQNFRVAPKFLDWLCVISTAALSFTTLGVLISSWWKKQEQIVDALEFALLLVQSLAWLCLAITVKLSHLRMQTPRFFQVWWVATFLLGTYAAISAILEAYHTQKTSTNLVLAVASWPVCCLLLCNAFKQQSKISSMEEGEIEEPLVSGASVSQNGHNTTGTIISPFASVGFFKRMSFWWLNPLLSLGYQRPLEQKDIPDLSEEDEVQKLHEKFVRALDEQKNDGKPFSVFWALALCFWKPMVVNGGWALGKTVPLSMGPIVLKFFIDYTSGQRAFPHEGFVLVGGLFLAKFLESLSQRQWYFGSRRVGLQVRSALMAAIYQKDLRLSNAGKQRHAAGEVVNYMAIDAYRIGEFLYWLHFSWTLALQICFALAILGYAIGWATLAALVVIAISVGLNTPLARSQNRNQTQLMVAQDARLRATTESLRNMKILKLQAWEHKFKDRISNVRETELKWLSAVQYRRGYNSCMFWLTPIIASTATFTSCLILGTPLTASNVFTALATLRLVQEPIRLVPDLVATTIQMRISLARVSKFLQEDELQTDAVVRDFSKSSEFAIQFEEATFNWDPEETAKPTLKNLNFKVKHGQRVAVCGEVGAGKSSFIQAILGEIPKVSGVVRVSGSVAYVAQTAWIQSGSVQDNILFGQPMDRDRYKKTLKVCALEKDLEGFPFGDLTEIGERGINMSGGQKQRLQLARAVYQDADVYLLDDPLSAVDAHTGSSLFNGCVMDALEGKTVILVTHQVEFLPAVDTILLLRDGEIWQAGPYDELRSAGTAFEDLVTAHEEVMGGMSENHTNSDQNSSTQELQKLPSRIRSRREDSLLAAKQNKKARQLTEQEEKELGNSSTKAYLDYLKQDRGFLYFGLSTFCHLIFLGGQVASNWWMASEIGNPATSSTKLIFVYSSSMLCTGIAIIFRLIFGVILGLRASRSFFTGLMDSLFRAPMAFFDSTPTGRIISRVSSELSILDLDVGFAFGFSMAGTTIALSSIAVASSVTWQILIVTIPFIFITRWLQNYYLTSARQIMRINGTTKAPIINHFEEAIAGGSTIRAFHKESEFVQENFLLINANSSPFFHSIGVTEWLIQRLEFVSSIILSASALVIVLLPEGQINPGFAGLVITYGLSLNISVVFSVQNQCDLANMIISVERIKQYMNLPSEAPAVIDDKRPPVQWPNTGKVQLQNLQVRYQPNAPLVLRGITCTFQGGQRVGVVGRTGSGKTTLISSLFRLVEPAGGKILIDGLDISTIGLHDLRSRLGIIPQEPTLFRGTVRFNLDPLNEHSDREVWEALEKCQLGDVIRAKQERLDAPVSDDGENWSVGQRQLFCLGRALLKQSRILVLDEATASIDNTTDAILQRIIREGFSNCTVITVAHRIPTVIDSDMVLALQDGKMIEYDQPTKLLQNSSSLFARLVAEYWANTPPLIKGSLNNFVH